MFVDNVTITEKWQEITVANTGDEFLLQNKNTPCEYIVMSGIPDDNVHGGILPSYSQLDFKKVSGNLYMKTPVNVGEGTIYIERVEA